MMNEKNNIRLKILQHQINPTSKDKKNSPKPSLNFKKTSSERNNRAVFISGIRTPFVKSFGKFMELDAISLGVTTVKGLIKKTNLDPKHIDQVIWGNVVMNVSAPNVGREIVLDSKLPKNITGVTVSKACLSGLEAIIQAVNLIEHGDADCVIAGGSESMSNAEIVLPKNLKHALGIYQYGKNKGFSKYSEFFKMAGSPFSWAPKAPAIAERSTGKTMGYHADVMAEINKVDRKSQDTFSLLSHSNSIKAKKNGYLNEEIVPVKTSDGKVVKEDNLIREKGDPSKMEKLKPCFRNENGTVTAASSSALTDGSSAVLIMSEKKAKELGFPIDIVMDSYSSTAIDPDPQLLLAPAIAIPQALKKANLKLNDMDFIEMHEAFAAQVLATLNCLKSKEFSKKFLNTDEIVGEIPSEKLNINGGSIAIGHPFSATGGRLITSAMNELRRNKKKHCLISICAAGGLGGVCILTRRE